MGLFNKNKNKVIDTGQTIESIKSSIDSPTLPKLSELPKPKELSQTASDMIPMILAQMQKQQQPQPIPEPKEDMISKSSIVELVKELEVEIKARQEAMTLLKSLL